MELATGPAVEKKPNRRAKAKKEVHTSQFTPDSPSPITMPALDQSLPDLDTAIQAVESPLTDDYAESLRFNEDPITIVMTQPNEKFPLPAVECWVNGKGIEVLINGKWLEFKAIPFGKKIVTKRKYVEVLARTKIENVTTKVGTTLDPDPQNEIIRTTSLVNHFQVIFDPSPKATEWLSRILTLRGS